MTQSQWEQMTDDLQTQHCLEMTRLWLAEALPPLYTGGGAARVASGQHIYSQEEDTP